ncbi:YveK family protein [Clostridium saudiense]|uniref:YveK family protein n=1 Tax=Clostridium saudiense TaxID=1414720 RepID=UPI0018AC4643|nr:Wzz/FepE/Etk N-terminal domain-containing protein [Clostridium saudiense]
MEDKLFDFEELWYLFKRRFWIIIVIPVLMTSLALYKVSKLKPSYSASAKVFMGNSNDMLDIYSQDELSYYSQFITIFSEISKIDGFLDDTLKKNKIDKTSLEVASSLSFSSSENTPIVNIYYSSYTDEQMEETLNAVCDELIDTVREIMPGTNPTVLSEARVATIYPNKTKLPMIAFAAGIIISIGLILVLDYLDSRIMSKKQLEKIIPVAVLGSIPIAEREFRKENKNVHNEKNAQVTVSGSL